jgi:non-specific serine/threonine protein kinase
MAARRMPNQPTPLIGRETEVLAVSAAIRDPATRLLTITGPGGSGKTRLAIAAADAVGEGFRHGAVFVDLSRVREATVLTAAIGDSLGVQDVGTRPLLDAVIGWLVEREVLLVLDNLEHLRGGTPALATLLEACPGLRILATSREPLHLRWEQRFPLTPLRLPNVQEAATVEVLAEIPACRLFVERARAVKPDFRLTSDNAPHVSEICRRVDGLPLGIELAAARIALLTPRALMAQLTRTLDLRSTELDRPDRHRGLRDTIGWSHSLLDSDEKRVFRRLAVFAGDATLTAATAVCGADDERESEMLNRLESLVDKGLLQPRDSADVEPRFRMLETIREYAWERLEGSGDLVETRLRHLRFYAALVARTEAGWWGPHVVVWADQLESELGNLRAALAWSLDVHGDVSLGLDIVSFPYFWDLRGHIGEARDWLARLLAAPEACSLAIEYPRGLTAAAFFALMVGDQATALAHVQEAVPLARVSNDPGTQWFAISVLGHTFRHVDVTVAEPFLREADSIARAANYTAGIVGEGFILGECRRAVGDLAGARALFEECLETAHARQVAFTAAFAQRGLGHLDWMQGEYQRAEGRLQESLRLHGRMRFARGIADVLEALAWNAASRGRPERAARLLGAAAGARESLGIGIQGGHVAPHEQSALTARTRLGHLAYETAFATGRAWTAQEAVAWALAAESAMRSSAPGSLTPREREVALLLAQDLSNRQIADALVVAERTAETHVTNILTKLNLSSRVQVRPWAVAQGLVPPT